MKLIIKLSYLLVSINICSQDLVSNIISCSAPIEYENIHVQKTSSDSLASTFVIWIKQKLNFTNIYHRENVIIQEGSGKFQLKDSIYNVSTGDIITIPKNSWHGVTINSKIPMKVISIQSPEFLGKDRIFKN